MTPTHAQPRHFIKPAPIAALLALACLIGLAPTRAHGQAEPTATRSGDLQIGGTFQDGDSDYAPERFRGYGIYTSFDFRYRVGLEAEFHQISGNTSSQGIYERTYEIGPRYILRHGRRMQPYIKPMFGRGVFNFPAVGPGLHANLAYNIVSAAVGVDYRLSRSITLRAAFEYQNWMGFPPHGLNPKIVDIGAAYHFH
jgi:hypothetical protein